jgi:mRNA interferase RelE/StbE
VGADAAILLRDVDLDRQAASISSAPVHPLHGIRLYRSPRAFTWRPTIGSGTFSSALARTTSTDRRALSETLPEAVAAAAYEFITGPLLTDPHRIGKRLLPPMDDRFSARRGTYRVIYRIDDKARVVTVVDVAHRRDAYRT